MRESVLAGLFLLVVLFLPLFCRAQTISIPNILWYEAFREFTSELTDTFAVLGYAVCGLAFLVGVLFILVSGGNPDTYNKGKKIILYALLGFVIVVLVNGFVPLVRYSFGTGGGGGGGGAVPPAEDTETPEEEPEEDESEPEPDPEGGYPPQPW